MKGTPKLIAILLLILLSLGCGIWMGEDIHNLLGLTAIPLAAAAFLLIASILIHGPLRQRLLLPVILLAALIAGHQIGNHRAYAAFSACYESGEAIRQALADHKARTGSYPDQLSQLPGPLPGGRILRPSLLEYQRTATGYQISFRDWLVSHSATEAQPFTPHK